MRSHEFESLNFHLFWKDMSETEQFFLPSRVIAWFLKTYICRLSKQFGKRDIMYIGNVCLLFGEFR